MENDQRFTDTGVFKKQLTHVLLQWAQHHAGKLASGTAGLLIGGITAYLAIWTQLQDARHVALDTKADTERLSQSISNLATRDQVQELKDRVDDLWKWREQIYDKADVLPPKARFRPPRK